MMPEAQATEAKINRHYIKLKSFYAKMEKNKMKIQPIELEKTFANHILDKGLISKICQGLSRFNNKTPKHLTKQWTEELKRTSSKRTSNWTIET